MGDPGCFGERSFKQRPESETTTQKPRAFFCWVVVPPNYDSSPSYFWSLRKLPSETSITLLDMKSLSWSIVGMVIKLTKQKLKVFILTWLWLKKQESEWNFKTGRIHMVDRKRPCSPPKGFDWVRQCGEFQNFSPAGTGRPFDLARASWWLQMLSFCFQTTRVFASGKLVVLAPCNLGLQLQNPILRSESRHSRKFFFIVGHQHQSLRTCMPRNQLVIKSHLTLMSILHEVPGSIDSIIPLHPQIILHEVAKSTLSKSEGKLPPMGEVAHQQG